MTPDRSLVDVAVRSRRLLVVAIALVLAACASGEGVADDTQLTETITTDDVVVIEPGDDAAAIIEATPPGTEFRFTEGLHRGVAVTPRAGDRLTGESGAVLSGAIVLDATEVDGRWVAATDHVFDDRSFGRCDPAAPLCGLREELFVDEVPWQRVAEEPVGAAWTVDETSGQVVLGQEPGGEVELSVLPWAVRSDADDVAVSGLTFVHYANLATIGVIHMDEGAERWELSSCVVLDSHGVGAVVRDAARVFACWIEGMGQQGLGGAGTGLVVEHNTFARNTRLGFERGWSVGGAKFGSTIGLEVRHNAVLDNAGPGLWTDTDAVDTTYEHNWVEGNSGPGIFHEISQAALIRGNRVIDNGHGESGWVWGAGIQVASSVDVVVTGNVVEANRQAIIGTDQGRGDGAFGPRILDSLTVVDNEVVDSGQTGIAQDQGDRTVYERDHVFAGNSYRGAVAWSWLDAIRSFDEWQGVGHDLDGSFTP